LPDKEEGDDRPHPDSRPGKLRRGHRYGYAQPQQPKEGGVTYKAVVSTLAKDVAGNRLDQDDSTDGLQQKVWFFEIDN
jgi:hypothetical protein